MDGAVSPSGRRAARQKGGQSKERASAIRVLARNADLLSETLPTDDTLVAARTGTARPAPEGGPQPVAGDSPSAAYHYVAPIANRSNRVRQSLGALVLVTDVAMLALAFVLGYLARFVPLLDNEQIAALGLYYYVPTMVLHVITIIVIFFISRLYHQRRVTSRFDVVRTIVGSVTIGAVLASGSVALVFNNTQFDVDYPRTMFFYVWLFSATFAVVGREANLALSRFLRDRGIGRENLLILGAGKIARDIAKK